MYYYTTPSLNYRYTTRNRQYTYNVILRCFRATISAVEKQEVLRIVSVCLWPWLYSTQTLVPCCIIVCGLSGYTISLPIISQTARSLEKKSVNTKCVFWFLSTTAAWNIFILIRIQRYTRIVINVHRSSCKVPFIMSGFHETRTFLDRFSKKIFKYEISWKSAQWEPSCSVRKDGGSKRRTDKHDKQSL